MESLGQLIAKMPMKYKPPILEDYLKHPDIAEFVRENEQVISQKMLNNSLSKFNEYVVALKKVDETGYEPVLFINYHNVDVAYQRSDKALKLAEAKRLAGLVENSTMSKAVQAADFNDMHMTKERLELIKFVKEFATNYIHDLQTRYDGVFVSGGYGIGKTYILSALANYIARYGKAVRIEHFPTFVNLLKEKIRTGESGGEVRKIKASGVLILDDFGAEKLTEWLRDDVILVILEHRMNNMLPTFITSNLTMAEMREYLANTREGVDYRKADRIMERMKFLMSEIKLTGTNKRNPEGRL